MYIYTLSFPLILHYIINKDQPVLYKWNNYLEIIVLNKPSVKSITFQPPGAVQQCQLRSNVDRQTSIEYVRTYCNGGREVRY